MLNNHLSFPKLNGFTLLELIIVIVIISVLAVSAFTRISDTSGYAEYAYQARLISALRNMQTRAMHDTRTTDSSGNTFCFQVNLDSSPASFGPPTLSYVPGNGTDTCSGTIDFTNPDYLTTTSTEMAEEGVALSTSGNNTVAFAFIGFDSLGNPLTGGENCSTTCIIELTGEEQVKVCVEPRGYVHACE